MNTCDVCGKTFEDGPGGRVNAYKSVCPKHNITFQRIYAGRKGAKGAREHGRAFSGRNGSNDKYSAYNGSN